MRQMKSGGRAEENDDVYVAKSGATARSPCLTRTDMTFRRPLNFQLYIKKNEHLYVPHFELTSISISNEKRSKLMSELNCFRAVYSRRTVDAFIDREKYENKYF